METKKYVYHVIVELPDRTHDFMYYDASDALASYEFRRNHGYKVRMTVESRC